MPNHSLERLGVRRSVRSVYCRNNNADIGDLRGVAAIATYNPDHRRPTFPCQLQRRDQIWTHVFLGVSAADRENQERVLRLQPASFKPLNKYRCPAFVVCPRRQLSDVVGRRITFHPRNFPEIVDGMGGVRRAAPNSENEEPAAARTDCREKLDCFLAKS